MTKRPAVNRPKHAIVINGYAEYRDDIQRFANGKYNCCIVIGTTGLSKTETLLEMVGGNPLHYEGGEPSSFQFFCDLHKHRDEFVILDDVSPKFYRDSKTNSYLKVLTNTKEVKTLRWPTNALDAKSDPPNVFETRSRVIILTNEWKSASEHVRALEGRAFSIVFEPTPTEVHHEVGRRGWFTDQEVYDFVWENRRWITVPDMRVYKKIEEQKHAGANWRKRGLEMLVGNERLQPIVALLADPELTTNTARANKFVELGYGGSTLFYDLLREFRYYKLPDESEPPPKLGQSKSASSPKAKPKRRATISQGMANGDLFAEIAKKLRGRRDAQKALVIVEATRAIKHVPKHLPDLMQSAHEALVKSLDSLDLSPLESSLEAWHEAERKSLGEKPLTKKKPA